MTDKPEQPPGNDPLLKPLEALSGMNLDDIRQLNRADRLLADGFTLQNAAPWLQGGAYKALPDTGVEQLDEAARRIASKVHELV